MQAAVHRCSSEVDFMEKTSIPYPATINDDEMYEHAKSVGEALLGKANVQRIETLMAAEDFGYIVQLVFIRGR